MPICVTCLLFVTAMARLCCDSRASVRQTSITYLQRALLSHDLHNLTGDDWHSCFTQVCCEGQSSWHIYIRMYVCPKKELKSQRIVKFPIPHLSTKDKCKVLMSGATLPGTSFSLLGPAGLVCYGGKVCSNYRQS